MNGILEIEDFKSTFKEIAVADNSTDMMAKNFTCSSENDASATILIVSNCTDYLYRSYNFSLSRALWWLFPILDQQEVLC